MNVLTASAILLEQVNQLTNIIQNIALISTQINNIANQENQDNVNSIPDVNARIKALCGAMNVQLVSTTSQTVLVQQALDQLSELVN